MNPTGEKWKFSLSFRVDTMARKREVKRRIEKKMNKHDKTVPSCKVVLKLINLLFQRVQFRRLVDDNLIFLGRERKIFTFSSQQLKLKHLFPHNTCLGLLRSFTDAALANTRFSLSSPLSRASAAQVEDLMSVRRRK